MSPLAPPPQSLLLFRSLSGLCRDSAAASALLRWGQLSQCPAVAEASVSTIDRQQHQHAQASSLSHVSLPAARPGAAWATHHMHALFHSHSGHGPMQQRGAHGSAAHTTNAATQEAGAEKSNRIEFSPISKAVALLLSQDVVRDRHRVVMSMSKLCLDMAGNMKQYSPTEVAAFCEAAKKLDFCTQALADAVMEYFPGKTDQLHEEELLGVIWVVAKKDDVDSSLAMDLGEAVNRHLEDLRHEDIADMLMLMASICPASSFLLTALSDEALSRLPDLSPTEVCALVSSFGSEVVRRSLFDDKTFKDLSAHVLKTVEGFTQTELRSILSVYRNICPRRHSLVATLALMEDELAPFVSPSPQ